VSQYVVVHFLTIKYLLTFFDAYQREQSNWATTCDIQIFGGQRGPAAAAISDDPHESLLDQSAGRRRCKPSAGETIPVIF